MPRPKGAELTKVLGVAVSQETADRLKGAAAVERRKPGELHRIILEDGLAQREKQNASSPSRRRATSAA